MFGRLNGSFKTAVQICTVLGFMASGLVWMETRYARAAEVTAQFSDVKILILENRLHDLSREKWQLEGCQTQPPCRDRARQIEVDLQQVQEQLRILRERAR
jgi:hypothetical protein